MRPVTIIRAHIPAGEVAEVLSVQLGPRYSVSPRPASEGEEVLVAAHGERGRTAVVRIAAAGDRTVLTVRPGGLAVRRLMNRFGVASRVVRILRQSAELRMDA